MKFKIISMLIVLGLLSIMPLVYMGKLDPVKFFDKVDLSTTQLRGGISKLKTKVPSIANSAEVKVYKWHNANGIMQFGGQPPLGITGFEQVSFNTNKNVVDAVKVPLTQETDEVLQEISAPSPYSVKKMMDDAKGVEDMLKKSQEDRKKVLRNL